MTDLPPIAESYQQTGEYSWYFKYLELKNRYDITPSSYHRSAPDQHVGPAEDSETESSYVSIREDDEDYSEPSESPLSLRSNDRKRRLPTRRSKSTSTWDSDESRSSYPSDTSRVSSPKRQRTQTRIQSSPTPSIRLCGPPATGTSTSDAIFIDDDLDAAAVDAEVNTASSDTDGSSDGESDSSHDDRSPTPASSRSSSKSPGPEFNLYAARDERNRTIAARVARQRAFHLRRDVAPGPSTHSESDTESKDGGSDREPVQVGIMDDTTPQGPLSGGPTHPPSPIVRPPSPIHRPETTAANPTSQFDDVSREATEDIIIETSPALSFSFHFNSTPRPAKSAAIDMDDAYYELEDNDEAVPPKTVETGANRTAKLPKIGLSVERNDDEHLASGLSHSSADARHHPESILNQRIKTPPTLPVPEGGFGSTGIVSSNSFQCPGMGSASPRSERRSQTADLWSGTSTQRPVHDNAGGDDSEPPNLAPPSGKGPLAERMGSVRLTTCGAISSRQVPLLASRLQPPVSSSSSNIHIDHLTFSERSAEPAITLSSTNPLPPSKSLADRIGVKSTMSPADPAGPSLAERMGSGSSTSQTQDTNLAFERSDPSDVQHVSPVDHILPPRNLPLSQRLLSVVTTMIETPSTIELHTATENYPISGNREEDNWMVPRAPGPPTATDPVQTEVRGASPEGDAFVSPSSGQSGSFAKIDLAAATNKAKEKERSSLPLLQRIGPDATVLFNSSTDTASTSSPHHTSAQAHREYAPIDKVDRVDPQAAPPSPPSSDSNDPVAISAELKALPLAAIHAQTLAVSSSMVHMLIEQLSRRWVTKRKLICLRFVEALRGAWRVMR